MENWELKMFCKKSQESATLPSKSVAQMATVVEQEHKTRYWGYLPQGLARTILKIIYIENIEATENIEVIENIEMFSNLYLPRFQFSHTNLSYKTFCLFDYLWPKCSFIFTVSRSCYHIESIDLLCRLIDWFLYDANFYYPS